MGKYELRYRVIPNCTCNDFNNELPYTLVSVDYDRKTNLIRQKGFNTWAKHNCDLFTNRKSAEKQLCELNYNIFFNKEKDQRIAELEQELAELKEKAIVLPKNLQVGNKVFWANEDGLFIGEIKTISQDTAVWFYVVYDNGLTYWHLLKDFNNEVFATKQEAQAKLKEIKENE